MDEKYGGVANKEIMGDIETVTVMTFKDILQDCLNKSVNK